MAQYSEQDLKHASEFRDGIHKDALEIIRKTHPEIPSVVDRWPVEAYFQQHWDYPGRWYTIVAIPEEFHGRAALIDAIVQDTLEHYHAEENREQGRIIEKKIDAAHYDYEKLFTVSVDQNSRSVTIVGQDDKGRFILEKYEEYNRGSAVGSVSKYYILTDAEYRRYAKKALINGTITQEEYDRLCDTDTLRNLAAEERDSGERQKEKSAASSPHDPVYELIAQYPDCVIDYCIIEGESAYQGYESHRAALKTACEKLFAPDKDGNIWQYNVKRAMGKRIGTWELFTSNYPKDKLNYRKAFLYPPHENSYSGKDFVRVNAALFPNGTESLEAYEWTTDWSDYFDDGHEWWGALCLTVYDGSLDRFTVIMASATD